MFLSDRVYRFVRLFVLTAVMESWLTGQGEQAAIVRLDLSATGFLIRNRTKLNVLCL